MDDPDVTAYIQKRRIPRVDSLETALERLIDTIEDCDTLRKSTYVLAEMEIEWRKIMDVVENAKRTLNDVD